MPSSPLCPNSLAPPAVASPCAGALRLGEAISCDGYRGGRLGDGKEEEGNTPSLPRWVETPEATSDLGVELPAM